MYKDNVAYHLFSTWDNKTYTCTCGPVTNIVYLPLRAMASAGAKEQFLRQMEQIVEGIKQSRIKVFNHCTLISEYEVAIL